MTRLSHTHPPSPTASTHLSAKTQLIQGHMQGITVVTMLATGINYTEPGRLGQPVAMTAVTQCLLLVKAIKTLYIL